jgi:hypothetical protein
MPSSLMKRFDAIVGGVFEPEGVGREGVWGRSEVLIGGGRGEFGAMVRWL